ncbi:MAG: hypothetical protein K2X87_21655 [Gemmataceae bacterium]|nr:hypothetical protein [Gemmataceae bacterium]
MLSKLWTKKASKKVVRSQALAFRPRLEAVEERLTPVDFNDFVITRPNGMPVTLAQPVGPGAPLLTTDPYQMMQTAKRLPGMLKTSVREAHDQLTWELNQLVQGLYPAPPMGSVATLLSYVNQTSQNQYPVDQTVTYTQNNFLFPGSFLTVTGRMTGTAGPSPNLQTHAVGTFTVPSGMWTDDGKLVFEWTADQASGQTTYSIVSMATWTGTKLLIQQDRAKSYLHFERDSMGNMGTDGNAEYHATGLAAAGSQLDILVNGQFSKPNGGMGRMNMAHGEFNFVTPLKANGEMRLKMIGDYMSNATYKLDTQYNATLASLVVPNDLLTVQVNTLAGTAVPNPSVVLNVKYGGGVLTDANDLFALQGVVEARNGITQSIRYGIEGKLKDVATGLDASLSITSGSGTRPSITTNVYYAPTPLFNLKLGYRLDPNNSTHAVEAGFSLDW